MDECLFFWQLHTASCPSSPRHDMPCHSASMAPDLTRGTSTSMHVWHPLPHFQLNLTIITWLPSIERKASLFMKSRTGHWTAGGTGSSLVQWLDQWVNQINIANMEIIPLLAREILVRWILEWHSTQLQFEPLPPYTYSAVFCVNRTSRSSCSWFFRFDHLAGLVSC